MTVINQLTLMLAACSRQGKDEVQSCQVCRAIDLEAGTGCSHLYDCHCQPHDNGPHANTTP